MPDTRPERRRLSAADWTHAALDAIAEGGLAAAAVEPLAKRLGATKGSFYWHFRDRRDLLDRALETWEREHTEAVIEAAEKAQRAPDRLAELLGVVFGAIGDPLELALLAAAGDPTVGPAVVRVTERRVEYVAGLYRAAGLDDEAARSRAVAAVSVYLGHAQLAAAAPGVLPAGAEWERHLERLGRELAPDRS
ncbi:helix-turn-helix domain containing protein [Tsukamurella sp. 8F]|uniref:TetR/AcrR family transcriptional regulator n=1 Tax=unclassified Tsukamurella TaxID=2633480 RepID=UPI0023B9C61F|nr:MULTISPECIES: helix-turn-helix domain-containing protein [unclassified Tsukamurella]MDF0530721.1 helix-turn-helix domain containing protein [Tsukamurella sp. 8J]MDF0587922.1 helix-turn-helix domain containing protein [Tsukamurella sp. 8F]